MIPSRSQASLLLISYSTASMSRSSLRFLCCLGVCGRLVEWGVSGMCEYCLSILRLFFIITAT